LSVRRVVFSSSRDLTRASRPGDSAQESSFAQDDDAADSLPDAAKPPAGHRSARRKIPGPHFAADLLRVTAQGLFSVLFPSNCRFCESPLLEISQLPVCRECLDSIQPILAVGDLCSRCGERVVTLQLQSRQLQDFEGNAVCGKCRLAEPVFEKAAAYGSYDAGMRGLIHLLKYEQVRPAAGVLGRMLAEVIAGLSEQFGQQSVLVVPVPLHSSRLRQRGFNHSELIARAALAQLARIVKPSGLTLRLAPAMLIRRRATASQTGLTEAQRRANVRGAFRVADRAAIQACDVLLVDDVYTTGTTVSECARVLRKAGAGKVWVATVARVLKTEPAGVDREEQGMGALVMAAKSG
jgi:ComF family protein